MKKPATYHHGDLRNGLLQAGLALLEEQGLQGLTLRGIAARAGVSHAAPAHHFSSLKGLLTAMVTLAYNRFAAALAHERATASSEPAEQMRAAGRGYLGFAHENAALFRLMFSAIEIDWCSSEVQQAANSARRQLSDIAQPYAAARGADPAVIETLIWSTVHGFAVLSIDGHLDGPGSPRSEMPDLVEWLFAG